MARHEYVVYPGSFSTVDVALLHLDIVKQIKFAIVVHIENWTL